MATLPTIGDIAAFQRLYSDLSKRGPLTSSTVSLPSYSRVYPTDSILGGTVGNPQVITGSGASAQSPLGSFYDTGQNIMGFNQDFLNQSFGNQGLQTALSAQYLDPIIDKNIDRTRAGILFADSRDPARQQQINKTKESEAKIREATALAGKIANEYGTLQLQSNIA